MKRADNVAESRKVQSTPKSPHEEEVVEFSSYLTTQMSGIGTDVWFDFTLDAMKLVQIMELLHKKGLPVKPDQGVYRSLEHGRTAEKERLLEAGGGYRPHE